MSGYIGENIAVELLAKLNWSNEPGDKMVYPMVRFWKNSELCQGGAYGYTNITAPNNATKVRFIIMGVNTIQTNLFHCITY